MGTALTSQVKAVLNLYSAYHVIEYSLEQVVGFPVFHVVPPGAVVKDMVQVYCGVVSLHSLLDPVENGHLAYLKERELNTSRRTQCIVSKNRFKDCKELQTDLTATPNSRGMFGATK